MEVKVREIIVSIAIGLIALSLGLFIDNLISEAIIDKKELYNKSLKIDNDKDTFKYAVDTNIGNVLVYGNFKVEKGVTYKELKNDYMYIEKVTEEYHRKTRTVCSGSGKSRSCRTETYYEWDRIDSDEKTIDKVLFLGKEFDFNKFSGYKVNTLDLENNISDNLKNKVKYNYLYKDKPGFFGSSVGDIRYYFNYTPKEFYGTIFVKATDKTIKDVNGSSKIDIIHNNLQETIDNVGVGNTIARIFFWLLWISLTAFGIYKYIELDNDYLDD